MSRETRPFRLNIPEAALEDLRGRLARTRLPDEPPLERWSTGTSRAYMEELVAYWRTGFDWRAQEASLNGLRQFTVPLGGIELHFIHEPGRGPQPIPLLLSHGWPGSIVEFRRLIPLLTERFTVVAPSLPGYALSFRPGQKRFAVEDIADLFGELMTDVLGYRRVGGAGRRDSRPHAARHRQNQRNHSHQPTCAAARGPTKKISQTKIKKKPLTWR